MEQVGRPWPRVVIHADLDAFFASVEQLDHPQWRGRPVLVGGAAEERGVVAAASYEARAYGARSAMPMRTALRLCPPDVVRAPPRFHRYSEVSRQIMALFRALTPLVEPLSLDEAYLDVTDVHKAGQLGEPAEAGMRLKAAVKEAAGLTISIGVATNKSVAKIASDLRKPDGFVMVPPGEEAAFLAPLPAAKLWGVGPKGEERLRLAGITTIGHLAAADRRWLEHSFGKWGGLLADLAAGTDTRAVSPEREHRSIGRETTFTRDVTDRAFLDETLARLANHVADQVQRSGLHARTVTVKLRHHDFQTLTRQARLAAPADTVEPILALARRLLDAELGRGARFRLLGVAVSGFEREYQLELPFSG